MIYLLDTNTVIAVFSGNTNVLARLKAHRPVDCGISAIVYHELFYGAYAGSSEWQNKNLDRIDNLRLVTLDFDKADAQEAGLVRAELRTAGTPIGAYDTLIAGQARQRGLVVVTHNTRHFAAVTNLDCEDWQ